jgi:hypothetical protein
MIEVSRSIRLARSRSDLLVQQLIPSSAFGLISSETLVQPVDGRLPVLAHQDHGRRIGGLEGQHQIEQDEGIGSQARLQRRY